jgi:hypothetical protein
MRVEKMRDTTNGVNQTLKFKNASSEGVALHSLQHFGRGSAVDEKRSSVPIYPTSDLRDFADILICPYICISKTMCILMKTNSQFAISAYEFS